MDTTHKRQVMSNNEWQIHALWTADRENKDIDYNEFIDSNKFKVTK